MKQKEQLAAQEQKLEELTLKICLLYTSAPEKAENQMEKETGENVRTETVVLPEGKIEFELDDAEEMFQVGDEAFPEGNFTQAQEGEEKNPSEPFSRNRNRCV